VGVLMDAGVGDVGMVITEGRFGVDKRPAGLDDCCFLLEDLVSCRCAKSCVYQANQSVNTCEKKKATTTSIGIAPCSKY